RLERRAAGRSRAARDGAGPGPRPDPRPAGRGVRPRGRHRHRARRSRPRPARARGAGRPRGARDPRAAHPAQRAVVAMSGPTGGAALRLAGRAAGGRRLLAVAVLVALAAPGVGHAQPGRAPSDVLREGNTAALAGDWQRVADLVDPLLREQLPVADLAEAHRLAGIAAFFAQRTASAEQHFVTYLRIEPDGRLDPALYPPAVGAFFKAAASRPAGELRALRVRPERPSWLFTLLPPVGQYVNGDHTKAYVLGGVLGALLITNLVTYSYLRQWCDHTQG